MENNVLLAVFKNQLSAYEVLNNIKGNFVGKNYVITEAAVVKKENERLFSRKVLKFLQMDRLGFFQEDY